MIFSYSRVSTYQQCPRKFKYQYIDGLETLPNYEPDNPLFLGTALHHGIETNVDDAIQEYMMTYPIATTKHTYEVIKLEHWIPKVKELIESIDGTKTYEFEVNTKIFKGFIDLLVKNEDGSYDIYDFKYSNNIDSYMKSGQLHVYKYFYEQVTGNKVRNLAFIFIPKVLCRQKKTETENQFMNRLKLELDKKEIQVKEVIYNEEKVNEFMNSISDIYTDETYEKNESKLCDWCDFKCWCHDGLDYNIIERKFNYVTKK